MRVLVLSGEGPYFKNSSYLDGTFFDERSASELEREYAGTAVGPLRLDALRFQDADGSSRPLLRSKRGLIPHLTSFTLESILRTTGADFELFRLERVWDGDGAPAIEPDVVFLSTTFICERHTLRRAIAWAGERYPGATLVLGGQYSNLKYAEVLDHHPSVDMVVRGDGEDAIPALLSAIAGGRGLDEVPNLAMRDAAGAVRTTRFAYVDLEAHPSPSLDGTARIVPYESMRGCPFSCRFCSFPAASPKWRYKSAAKIAGDWARYAEESGAEHIRAMDSTFTVPYGRLHELLGRLDGLGVTWEAYSRANNLKGPELVDDLAASGCTKLSIGFESMSDATLGAMNKLVTSAENRRAFELLRDSAVGYRISVMVGYPGETPEEFEHTHRFLVDEFAGHYMLSVFSFLDETMPVWADADRFGLQILDPDNPDYGWTHDGMDADTAMALQRRTLDETRLRSEQANVLLWQTDYQTPLVPHLPQTANMRLEKLVERLGMAPRDHPDAVAAAPGVAGILDELRSYGVTREEATCSTA